MGNYDDGTGHDRDECGCAYDNPIEKALGDESFAWTKAHTSDGNKRCAFLATVEFVERNRRTWIPAPGEPDETDRSSAPSRVAT